MDSPEHVTPREHGLVLCTLVSEDASWVSCAHTSLPEAIEVARGGDMRFSVILLPAEVAGRELPVWPNDILMTDAVALLHRPAFEIDRVPGHAGYVRISARPPTSLIEITAGAPYCTKVPARDPEHRAESPPDQDPSDTTPESLPAAHASPKPTPPRGSATRLAGCPAYVIERPYVAHLRDCIPHLRGPVRSALDSRLSCGAGTVDYAAIGKRFGKPACWAKGAINGAIRRIDVATKADAVLNRHLAELRNLSIERPVRLEDLLAQAWAKGMPRDMLDAWLASAGLVIVAVPGAGDYLLTAMREEWHRALSLFEKETAANGDVTPVAIASGIPGRIEATETDRRAIGTLLGILALARTRTRAPSAVQAKPPAPAIAPLPAPVDVAQDPGAVEPRPRATTTVGKAHPVDDVVALAKRRIAGGESGLDTLMQALASSGIPHPQTPGGLRQHLMMKGGIRTSGNAMMLAPGKADASAASSKGPATETGKRPSNPARPPSEALPEVSPAGVGTGRRNPSPRLSYPKKRLTPTMVGNSEWPPERVALLVRLYADGLTMSEIARRLGGITKNAIAGKVHRLKRNGVIPGGVR